MNPKKGERWKSKTTGKVIEIRSFGSGVVTFKADGEIGTTTRGILKFREEFERK